MQWLQKNINMSNQPAYGACSVVYRLADGREQHLVAYIPNEQVRKTYIERANKFGLEVKITPIKNK